MVDTAIVVTDVDDTNLDSAIVAISAGLQAGDVLAFTNQNGITGTYDSATGVLTLTGGATVANYQTALRTVQFRTTSDNPTTSPHDRLHGQRRRPPTRNTDTKAITVTPVNDAPIDHAVGLDADLHRGRRRRRPSTAASPSPTPTTPTSSRARCRSPPASSAGDTLTFTPTTGSPTPTRRPDVLTLTGTATVADWQTVLRSVPFPRPATTRPATRTVEFTVNDGDRRPATPPPRRSPSSRSTTPRC